MHPSHARMALAVAVKDGVATERSTAATAVSLIATPRPSAVSLLLPPVQYALSMYAAPSLGFAAPQPTSASQAVSPTAKSPSPLAPRPTPKSALLAIGRRGTRSGVAEL